MDNIWRKATENIHKHKERLAVNAATKTTPAHTNSAVFALTEENMNTVEKINIQLARMELNWAQTRSGPFPERARTAIAKLQASLEEQDTGVTPLLYPADPMADLSRVTTTTPAPTNTATTTTTFTTTTTNTNIPTPTNTAPTTYKTKTTLERLDHIEDVH